ncbi:FecCD family ABC transporter permease [Nocardioides insulae]|uniref:FecCD family ABC transporter permease n=1 Tax=Nocardioides insulae TaxID=394734 RepID=UPI0003FC1CAE|nr:iron chelate uptake ABC transporter family permease subunit [Nocardioides insulae]
MSTPTTSPAPALPHLPPRANRRRRVVVPVATGVALLALAVLALGLGDYPLTPVEVVSAFSGQDGFASTVVLEWRLPRVLAALAFGAALGVSGALFQSLTQNPLGSPDIIGFSSGSFTGVLIGMTLLPALAVPQTVWALAGGLLTALVVYALAYRRGVQGLRLIVTGIAVTAMLQALNVWMLLRAQEEVAMSASAWAAGSLNLVDWDQLLPSLILLVVAGAAVRLVVSPLRQLELGDDAAAGHGLRLEPARLGVLVLGVALTALPTAVAGPIAFVSLASPHLAKRLVGGAGLPLVQSALMGALVLLSADLIAQHALPTALPVGIVTVVLGGSYLVVLLLRGAGQRR